MNKFFTLALLVSTPAVFGMQTTAKKQRPERTPEEKIALQEQQLKGIHRTLLHTLQERQARLINDTDLAGRIDESFKALSTEAAENSIVKNIKLKRNLTQRYNTLLSDALKLAQSLKDQSDSLYDTSLEFDKLSHHYQEAVLENLTSLNSLYNALAPLGDYLATEPGYASDPEDKATIFKRTMQDALQKIVYVRQAVL